MSRSGSLDSLSYNIQCRTQKIYNVGYFMQYRQMIGKKKYIRSLFQIYININIILRCMWSEM